MFTSSRVPQAAPPPVRTASVAVDVADPDLRADVRAVLAAVGAEESDARHGDVGGSFADVVVTDRSDARGAGGRQRLVLVCADGGVTAGPAGAIPLPSGLSELVDALVTAPRGGEGAVLVVVGAVGGCGASTLAVALAVRAGVLLVDADPKGAGLDLLVGLEDRPGLRIDEIRSDLGAPDPAALDAAAPGVAGVTVLSRARGETRADGGAVAPAAARIAHARRAEGGIAVVDAGVLGPDGATARAVAGADRVVVVTRGDLTGVLAMSALVDALGDRAVPVVTRRDRSGWGTSSTSWGRRVWGPVWSRAAASAAAGGVLAERVRGATRWAGCGRLARVADGILEEVGVDVRV